MNAATAQEKECLGQCDACGQDLVRLGPNDHKRVPRFRAAHATKCGGCGGLHIDGTSSQVANEILGPMSNERFSDDVKYFDLVVYKGIGIERYRVHGWYNVKTGAVVQWG